MCYVGNHYIIAHTRTHACTHACTHTRPHAHTCTHTPSLQDERTLSPLTLGCISSYYYLHHMTVRLFREKLHPHSSFEDLLQLLCVSGLADLHTRALMQVPQIGHTAHMISSYGHTRIKLSREKTFANFEVLWLFTKIFFVTFGDIASLATLASNPQKFFFFS